MLPSFNTSDTALGRMQSTWAAILNKFVDLPLLQGIQLKNISLVTGANVINHKLGRAPQGYIVTRFQVAGSLIYDTQATNQMPELTLNLTSSANTTVDLWVY